MKIKLIVRRILLILYQQKTLEIEADNYEEFEKILEKTKKELDF